MNDQSQYQQSMNSNFIDQNKFAPIHPIRHKRSTGDEPGEYTIELLIVVDRKVAEFHGRGLQEYILTIMREVN